MEEQKIIEIFEALKSEKLTERERFLMRKELELLMKNRPVRIPLHVEIMDYLTGPQSTFIGRHAYASAFALVLIFGVSTSYAAQNSLPGDVLYPVKVNVNEQVQGVLAVSEVEKADWSSMLAERRLEEAEALAAQGTLTIEHGEALAEHFDKSTRDFEKYVASLAEAPEDAGDARSNLDASLAAHARVLENLSEKLPSVARNISPILSSVRQKVQKGRGAAITSAKIEIAAMAAPTDLRSMKNSYEDRKGEVPSRLKERAEKRLSEVRALADSAKETLGTSTDTYTEDITSSTRISIQMGDQSAREGDWEQAIESYKNAIEITTEAKAGMSAQIFLSQQIQAGGAPSVNLLVRENDKVDDDD